MEWLTREFTAIEKVRRNVVLLAALASLLAMFPVRTDEVSFFGARFSSEVVAFGVFHALIFYTLVLLVRGIIHSGLSGIEREAFAADLQTKTEEIRTQIASSKAEWERLREMRRSQMREQARSLDQTIYDFRDEESRLTILIEDGRREPWAVENMKRDLTGIKREIQVRSEKREEIRISLERAEQHAEPLLEERAAKLKSQGPFVSAVANYLVIGEYVFPVVFGFIASALLWYAQDFPMLWNIVLHPR